MASVRSAFDSYVSEGAQSFFLNNIPEQFRNQKFAEHDLSASKPGEAFEGTGASDYVILGLGDRLANQSGDPQGYDMVQTGAAINLNGTGFSGAILTGDKNIGATGNADDNAIAGNAGNNLLRGEAGDDVMAGNDGNDRLDGGDGSDTLFGDAGDDVLLGQAGQDLMYGGEGNDKLSGGDDNDTLHGDAGNDSIWGDAGDDVLGGGDGNDSLNGGAGNDSLFGDDGNDFLNGLVGDDSLFGGAGEDTLFGSYGSDTLKGDAGADTFLMKHRSQGDVDVIEDFNPAEDIIDLSATGARPGRLDYETDSEGTTVTLQDGTKFKLLGHFDVDDSWFQF